MNNKRPKIYFIGQSHIDAAWLWTKDETLHICCKKTFESALALMEKYPEFKYAQSAAQYYEWMEKHYPEIFNKIKEKIEEGKWEIVGGSWVESDLNLPSGESLVRQFVYGKKYFKDKFGVDVRVAWFPDSFGFTATLPMILKGCDIDYFFTSKLSWNDMLRFPYYIFWWEAPDGSRVLAYQEISGFNDEQIKRGIQLMRELHNSDTMLVNYGRGDHGGGPTEEDIKRIINYKELYDINIGTVLDFFRDIEREAGRLRIPIVADELYLQFHRGTYTTQARIKRLIRRCEVNLEVAEKLASLAYIFSLSYPKEKFDKLWKILLFNQFHDIICGSSIEEVYRDSESELNFVLNESRKIIESSKKYLARLVPTNDNGAIVFNPTSWDIKAVVKIPVKETKKYILKDERNIYPAQLEDNLLFTVISVPPIGYKSLKLEEAEVKAPTELFAHEMGNYIVLENKYLRVRISKESGRITSIYNKVFNKEVLDNRGVRIEVYNDEPVRGRVTVGTYASRGIGGDAYGGDAWEIFTFQHPFSVSYRTLNEPKEVKLIETGPVRARVLVKYIYRQQGRQNSVFKHYIDLYYDLPYLVGTLDIEWRALHRLAKLAIDVKFYDESPAYEIPYGVIERKNIASPYASLFDRAKWEVSAHRWIDYYSDEENYGLALINSSKYGFDIVNRTIRMSLLRAALHPARYGTNIPGGPTDQGRHIITYALYPHKGSWRDAKVYKVAYIFNTPFEILSTSLNKGSLNREHSFISIEPENVVITTIKRGESDESLVIRLHEVEGKKASAVLRFDFKVKKVVETNLIERPIEEVKLNENTARINIKPYQLKTIKVFIK